MRSSLLFQDSTVFQANFQHDLLLCCSSISWKRLALQNGIGANSIDIINKLDNPTHLSRGGVCQRCSLYLPYIHLWRDALINSLKYIGVNVFFRPFLIIIDYFRLEATLQFFGFVRPSVRVRSPWFLAEGLTPSKLLF